MRRLQLPLLLLASVSVIVSCNRDDPSPTAPLQVDGNLSAVACRVIGDDFMDDQWSGAVRLGVERRIGHIRYLLRNSQPALARAEMFQLWDLVLKAYYAGKLPGGTSLATQRRVLFVGQVLYCFVGLDATGLTLNDPASGDVTQVVFPSATDQDLVHGSGNAGVRIYGNTLTAPVTISVTAITTNFAPYAGPLNTKLDQFGPFFHFSAVPDLTFATPVLVEECLLAPVGDLPATVDLAHNVGSGIEILPRATEHLLSCTTIGRVGPSARELWHRGQFSEALRQFGTEALTSFRPSIAWAGSTGVSGKPKNFSPFGGVNIQVAFAAASALAQSGTVGAAVASPPSVTVRTSTGTPLPGVAVTLTVSAGGGTIAATANGSPVTTVSTVTNPSGAASVAAWTLGSGRNAVISSASPPTNTGPVSIQIVGSPVTFTAIASGWSTGAAMPTPRETHGGAFVNGVFYAVGGCCSPATPAAALSTNEAYNANSDSWASMAPMPTAREELGVASANGILYAIGGDTGQSVPVSTVEAYDPATNSWTTKAPMPTARTRLSVSVVNGIVYAIGGSSSTSFLTTVEAYDPATDSWTEKAPMPTARILPATGAVGGMIYAMGGVALGGPTNIVEAYDPSSDSWTTKAPMPTARAGLGVGVMDGLLYAVGGSARGVIKGALESYDPTTNVWTSLPPMPTPLVFLAADSYNGTLYVIGGAVQGPTIGSPGTPTDITEFYHP